jgi:hypothetical protein
LTTFGNIKYPKMATFATKADERLLIKAVLDFANMDKIQSTDQVHQLFKRLPRTLVVDEKQFKELRPEETHIFEEGRDVLRDQLKRIAKSSAGRPKVGAEISGDVWRTIEVRYEFARMQLEQFVRLNGVQACVSMALAMILDRRRGITNRLQQCGAPGCGKFRLDFETKGRPAKHCGPEHKKATMIAKRRENSGRKPT